MSIKSSMPYVPSYLKSAALDGHSVQMTLREANIYDSNINSTSSFRYDPLGYPLKNTQQLNVDWSKFENHTFFMSAEVKVNDAFNAIINNFPFDGSKKDVETFLDNIGGYEKYVFDSFPTWSGALHFSGTQVGEDTNGTLGTWIATVDKSGQLYPDLSKDSSGVTILTPPADSSFSIEAQVFLPSIVNDAQVIVQKISSQDQGFSLFLEQSSLTTHVTATFCIASGSNRNKVSTVLEKGKYNHICVILNKEVAAEDALEFYLNEQLKNTSDNNITFGKLPIDDSDMLIGTGSSFYSENVLITPAQTFSGTMDEFRFFHSARKLSNQKLYASRGLYSTPNLKLYYRFNEPPPPLSLYGDGDPINGIVLDSSGNSLHSTINNFTGSLRINASIDELNPIKYEKSDQKKILFPAYSGVRNLNISLLEEAKAYDRVNPNNIIRLIPPHYLLEGAASQGFYDVEGNANDPYSGSGMPGQGEKGSTQLILSFLYIWAKFFDDIKLYIDSFSTLNNLSYENYDTIPDAFIQTMVRNYGFYIPTFFSNTTIQQYAEGENTGSTPSALDDPLPLKKIQASILKRILINLPDVIRSKGTQNSIKSFLRSVGIDPENSLRIREYGGSTNKTLINSREVKMENGAMVDFYPSGIATTPYLSSSRIEPGFPNPQGSFVLDENDSITGTTNASDGLLTSGSWTTSAIFKLPLIRETSTYQSLMRMFVTGSSSAAQPGLLFNVVASKRSNKSPAKIHLYGKPGSSQLSPMLNLSMDLPGEGIFDGDKWHISFGRKRNDEIGTDYVTSSYYFRAAKSEEGNISDLLQTSSYFKETLSSDQDVLQTILPNLNASGTYISIGTQDPIFEASGYPFLNKTSIDSIAKTVEFDGWASNLRFWSKSVNEEEWKEHVRNYRSVGSSDPLVKYNFTKNVSGSFNQLRLDSLTKQTNQITDSGGEINFIDYSQRNFHVKGENFITSSNVVVGEVFRYGMLSSAFDEAATEDKIRIRSFQSDKLLNENPWASKAPSYIHDTLFTNEEPKDDNRLSIEFSLVDALDRDIVNMLSTLETISDAIGRPELDFSPDYPDLERLRDVYFNRLSEKMNFRKFLEFYRWFDMSISTFIEQIIPSKTRYKGTNYVVESHLLERHKHQYRHMENYMGDKQVVNDSLLLQQIVGNINKY